MHGEVRGSRVPGTLRGRAPGPGRVPARGDRRRNALPRGRGGVVAGIDPASARAVPRAAPVRCDRDRGPSRVRARPRRTRARMEGVRAAGVGPRRDRHELRTPPLRARHLRRPVPVRHGDPARRHAAARRRADGLEPVHAARSRRVEPARRGTRGGGDQHLRRAGPRGLVLPRCELPRGRRPAASPPATCGLRRRGRREPEPRVHACGLRGRRRCR